MNTFNTINTSSHNHHIKIRFVNLAKQKTLFKTQLIKEIQHHADLMESDEKQTTFE